MNVSSRNSCSSRCFNRPKLRQLSRTRRFDRSCSVSPRLLERLSFMNSFQSSLYLSTYKTLASRGDIELEWADSMGSSGVRLFGGFSHWRTGKDRGTVRVHPALLLLQPPLLLSQSLQPYPRGRDAHRNSEEYILIARVRPQYYAQVC
jgi:hypothetical protein